MRALRRFLRRVANFTTGHCNDERLQEEMESHLTAMTEENIRAGMVPALARREARLKFGAVELVRGEYRAETGLPFVEDALMDLRYALRVLRNSPAFTLVATMTLMLGIGINVVAFGVVSAVLLRPLEISEPQNLYQLRLQPRTKFKLLTTSYPRLKITGSEIPPSARWAAFMDIARPPCMGPMEPKGSPAMRRRVTISICWECSRRSGGFSTRWTNTARILCRESC